MESVKICSQKERIYHALDELSDPELTYAIGRLGDAETVK